MKVSVIIPIYNVERFIVRCAESLMMQTLDDVEYIFVNDATPDGSIERLEQVLAGYPDRNTRIMTHSVNKGLPAARNTGLSEATGEYIFHCDSDDYVELDALEKMYGAAVEEDADIVWCDWYLSFDKNERYMRHPDYKTPDEALRGILNGAMKYNVWNKLARRSLYVDNAIGFPEGHSMGEDMTMICLFANARRVAYVPHALYHYIRTNGDSFTNTHSHKQLDDILYNAGKTIDYVRAQKGSSWEDEIAQFKLTTKLPFLISTKSDSYQIWKQWFPEANGHIMRNPELPVRTKLLQLAAAGNQFWLVRLYNILVNKLIYGVLYK